MLQVLQSGPFQNYVTVVVVTIVFGSHGIIYNSQDEPCFGRLLLRWCHDGILDIRITQGVARY